MDFRTLWGLIAMPQKTSATWLKPLVMRGALLFAFTVGFMVMRVKIMKAELPVFTM